MAREIPEERPWGERRSGGAGATRHALSNDDYRRQLDKLVGVNRADDRDD